MSAINKVIEQFPYGEWATRRRFITGLIFLVVFSITYYLSNSESEQNASRLGKLIGYFNLKDLFQSPQTLFIAAIIVFAVGSIVDAMIEGYIVRGVSISIAAFEKWLIAPSKNWRMSLRGIWWIFIIFLAFIFMPFSILACTVLNSLGSDKELETIGLPLARIGLMDSDECLLSDKAREFYQRLSPSIKSGLDQLYGDQYACAWQRLMDSVPEQHRIWVSHLNARSRDLASFTASAMFALILSFLVIPLNCWARSITYFVIFFLSYLLLGCAKIVRRSTVSVLELVADTQEQTHNL